MISQAEVGLVCAFGAGMRLNFKRLCLLTGKCARLQAARIGLTPQRIELMLIVRRWRVAQKEIAWMLCVSGPVVSRMLGALEDLGLVHRDVDSRDGRCRITRLTREGEKQLARCYPERRDETPDVGPQSEGEAAWLDAWRAPLTRLGIRVDSVARSRVPFSYEALAAWNSRYGYHLELENEYTLPP